MSRLTPRQGVTITKDDVSVPWDLYEQLCGDYDRCWKLTDDVLLEVCARYSDHTATDEVTAKLWIVSRTFAAGLERAVGPGGVGAPAALTRVADALLQNTSEVDAIVASIRAIQEPLDAAALSAIMQAHGNQAALVKERTPTKKYPRSWTSKYLHFHCPVVPIYDTYAVATIQAIYARQQIPSVCPISTEMDEWYVWYVSRFW